MNDRIIRTDSDGLCTLTINRPEKLNALDTPFFEALGAALTDIEASPDTVGCVIIRGAGRGFCAGVDLNDIGAGRSNPQFRGDVIMRLRTLAQPVIAAIHGACYTGGLELALNCDFIVADDTARFADTHAKWGLVAQWGMTELLPRRVGLSTAKRLTMTAATIDAQTARAMGLVDELAGEGGLDAAAGDLARAMLANSWFSNFAHKRAMLQTDGLPIAEGVARANALYTGRAPDYLERVAAFTAKK